MPKIVEECAVSPLKNEDVFLVINYFLNSEEKYLHSLGIDHKKLPSFEDWKNYMVSEHDKSFEKKDYFCLGWKYKNKLIGHSSIDHIIYNQQANMHLHIWDAELRNKGIGTILVSKSLEYYFKYFNFEKIYCEPKSENIPPRRILEKVGFILLKTYKTITHPICFEQNVNLFEIEKKSVMTHDHESMKID